LLSADEGGRQTLPHQHIRWDFLYDGDDPAIDGIWIIWPEFLSASGQVLSEGVIPSAGRALMYIVNPDMKPYHRGRIYIGTRGAFMEGSRKVGICEVVKIHGLADGNDPYKTNG
jgi:hypothetical protein